MIGSENCVAECVWIYKIYYFVTTLVTFKKRVGVNEQNLGTTENVGKRV